MQGRRRQAGGPVFRVLATAAVALLAACSGGGADVPEWAAEDSPGRTTSTTAEPPPALERVTASSSALEGDGESRFTGVAVGARAIVVIGERHGEAAIWTTLDGVTYDQAPLDEEDFPPGTVVHDVVVTTDGFVAVGSAAGRAAAWASPDGRAWRYTPLLSGEVADVVVVGELGMNAFGRDGGAIATWTSFDGSGWERIPGGAGVFDRPGDARVVGAYDDGDGFLAIVDRAGVAESWTSPDGRSWEPAPVEGAELLPADGPPRPTTLHGAGSTAVVLGAVEDPDGVDAAVWTSVAGAPWERVGPSETVFGGDGAQVVRAATQLGADLVAVGTDTDDEGDVDAVVWSTGAGGGWRRSTGEAGDGLSGAGDQHAVDVVPTRDGALVVGWEALDGAVRAVAWLLVDGEAEPVLPAAGPALGWQRVSPTGALGGPGEQRLDGVLAADGGFLAVGASTRPDEPDGDLDAALWASSEGTEWQRVPGTDATFGGPGDQRLLDVVEHGDALVAAGGDAGSAAVWVRFPGDAGWGRVPHDEAVFGGAGDQVARSVVVAPDGAVVAVGADSGSGDGDAAAWRSTGGRSWERVLPGGDLGGAGVQDMRSVVVVGPLLVAVGSSGDGAVAWTSLDGLRWDRTDLGPGVAHGVTGTAGGGAVAVGSLVDGAGELDATAWRTEDGRAWTPVPIDDEALGEADQQLLAVLATTTADDDQLVAGVGWTDLGPGNDSAAWASEDGEQWFRTPHDEDTFGGDQAQRMQALAELEDVVVAVGWTGSTPAERDAAVWVTAPAGGGGGVL